MFTVFSKLKKLIWTDDYEEEEGTSDTRGKQNVQGSNVYKTDITKRFDGKITHLYSSHGLINGDIYFSFDVVDGEHLPRLGSSVTVVAKQQHADGGWNAEQVTITDDFWDEDGNDEVDNGESRNEPNSIVGIISKFTGKMGIINDQISFIFDTIYDKDDYFPRKGDYVTADLVKTAYGDTIAENIAPLRRITRDGTVTASLQDHGYIDGGVHFTHDVCLPGYVCRKYDKVNYIAVESIQGQNKWRAIYVQPSAQIFTPSAKCMLSPTKSSFLEELQKDKNGIRISDDVDFGNVTLKETKTLSVTVENTGGSPQVFLGCNFPDKVSQFLVDHIEMLPTGTNGMKQDETEQNESEMTLNPGVSAVVYISVTGRSAGLEKQLLIMCFKKFKIGRYVTAKIVDPLSDLVERGQVYIRKKSRGRYQFREAVSSPNGWVVPGERPMRAMKYLPHKLPQYHVSNIIRDCVLNKDDIEIVAEYITEDLCYENYANKFNVLLQLEEIQMEIDIREFDLERVCFRPVGVYLALKVPGLAEGRPSILIGDKILVTNPGDISGPCYEGYVHELLSEEVLLKFNQDFHTTHNGRDFDVVFTFNRTPIRRCHQAVEVALNLGENVLFPTKLVPNICQSLVSVSEDFKSVVPINAEVTEKRPSMMRYFNENLNSRQKAAVNRIVQGQCRPLPYVLFGPPGTGKTLTVVEAILQILKKVPSSRILACAPSNSAADLIAERIHNTGLVKTSEMVRLNAAQRNEEVIPEAIKPYCSFGDNLELVIRHRIVICTCVTAGLQYSLRLDKGHFSHVFVDEAGQATEPEVMIPVCMVSGDHGQIILAGDPMQLGPVLRSAFSKRYGLELSFLERLIEMPLYARNETTFADHGSYDPLLVTKLVDNYRSHPAILSLSSKLFYHSELVERASQSLTHSFCGWSMLPNEEFPIIFHGCRGEDMREGNSPSWFNPVETVQVVRYLQGLIKSETHPLLPKDVGIITPYRKQVEKIRLLIDKLGMDAVKVGSVEEFQGQERQVIIISTVRSNERMIGFDRKHTLGFLSNPKRFNVAISRAQALLIIIGNPFILVQDKYWQILIDFCIQNGAYTGCDIPDLSKLETDQ